jgi:hypothetical protein
MYTASADGEGVCDGLSVAALGGILKLQGSRKRRRGWQGPGPPLVSGLLAEEAPPCSSFKKKTSLALAEARPELMVGTLKIRFHLCATLAEATLI